MGTFSTALEKFKVSRRGMTERDLRKVPRVWLYGVRASVSGVGLAICTKFDQQVANLPISLVLLLIGLAIAIHIKSKRCDYKNLYDPNLVGAVPTVMGVGGTLLFIYVNKMPQWSSNTHNVISFAVYQQLLLPLATCALLFEFLESVWVLVNGADGVALVAGLAIDTLRIFYAVKNMAVAGMMIWFARRQGEHPDGICELAFAAALALGTMAWSDWSRKRRLTRRIQSQEF